MKYQPVELNAKRSKRQRLSGQVLYALNISVQSFSQSFYAILWLCYFNSNKSIFFLSSVYQVKSSCQSTVKLAPFRTASCTA